MAAKCGACEPSFLTRDSASFRTDHVYADVSKVAGLFPSVSYAADSIIIMLSSLQFSPETNTSCVIRWRAAGAWLKSSFFRVAAGPSWLWEFLIITVCNRYIIIEHSLLAQQVIYNTCKSQSCIQSLAQQVMVQEVQAK